LTKRKYSKRFLEQLHAVTKKRPKTVIDHILEHGFITTEELRSQYGYDHPPRAARDVREEGIPLQTITVKNAEGRSIAAYEFADPKLVRQGRLGGRVVFPKAFKRALIEKHGACCSICLEHYEDRYLQVDHRVPYEVVGDEAPDNRNVAEHMLICGSCNRAKSWSCEHCVNWAKGQSSAICRRCYWAHPDQYAHVALQPMRRLELVWSGDEVKTYDQLAKEARQSKQRMPEYVKKVLAKLTGVSPDSD
jgi:hypothetical protein